jgi:hypothetical protein
MMSQGLLIDTRPGRASDVVRRLHWCEGLRFASSDGDRQIHAEWRTDRSGQLEGITEALRALDRDIIDVTLDTVI